MPGGAVDPEPFLMLLGAVTDVGVPAVAGMPGGQPVHQSVTDRFSENGGGGDGLTAGVPIDQCVMGVANFGQGQAIDDDAVRSSAVDITSATLAQRKTGQRGTADQAG